MDYGAAIGHANPHQSSHGLAGGTSQSPNYTAESPSHLAAATKTSELPAEALFEMLRFQLINGSLNTDITRGAESVASAMNILPTVIRNIS